MTRLVLPALLVLAAELHVQGPTDARTVEPSGLVARAQTPPRAPAAPEQMDDQAIVRAWIQRWNALGTDAASAVEDLLTLYAPDALHTTGPSPNQRGTATYRGHDGIRVLAERVRATQVRVSYRIETETANEQTAELLHVAAGPWKGASVGIQLGAVYTERDGGKRWVVPAAAFFQLADGKIRRARVYYAVGEKAEVEPEPPPRKRSPK